ncbi:hypothetical protein [Micromonospora sp. DT47]|uniref:hypothetical protein n=1 Tax=Micromonospora sp. DT47 TaxID=3393431 RepID=UPI003CF6F536
MPEHDHPRQPSAAIALMTSAWLVGLIVVAYLVWTAMWQGWAAAHGGTSSGGANWTLILLALTVFLWPLLTAVVAMAQRRRVATVVFSVLGVIFLLPAAAVGYTACQELRPASEPMPRVTQCMEHSGGDNRCPGG